MKTHTTFVSFQFCLDEVFKGQIELIYIRPYFFRTGSRCTQWRELQRDGHFIKVLIEIGSQPYKQLRLVVFCVTVQWGFGVYKHLQTLVIQEVEGYVFESCFGIAVRQIVGTKLQGLFVQTTVYTRGDVPIPGLCFGRGDVWRFLTSHLRTVFFNVHGSNPQCAFVFVVSKDSVVGQSFRERTPLATHILKLNQSQNDGIAHSGHPHPHKTESLIIGNIAGYTSEIRMGLVFNRNPEEIPVVTISCNFIDDVVFTHLHFAFPKVDVVAVICVQIAQGIVLIDVLHIRLIGVAGCESGIATCG